jgi:hypothetical protein
MKSSLGHDLPAPSGRLFNAESGRGSTRERTAIFFGPIAECR